MVIQTNKQTNRKTKGTIVELKDGTQFIRLVLYVELEFNFFLHSSQLVNGGSQMLGKGWMGTWN